MVDSVCWANNSTLAYPQGSESEDNSHSDMVTVTASENGTHSEGMESEDSSSDSGSCSRMIQPLTRARKGMTLRTCIVDLLKLFFLCFLVWGSLFFFLSNPVSTAFFAFTGCQLLRKVNRRPDNLKLTETQTSYLHGGWGREMIRRAGHSWNKNVMKLKNEFGFVWK